MIKNSNLIPADNRWTFEFIDEMMSEILKINDETFKFDLYPNQIEIVSSQQMIDAYCSHAMPVMYNHWKFGKDYLQNHNRYKSGRMGLAMEIVSNTDPCISYNMEDNSATTTSLVLAHANVGHNAFFKNNYLFKTWTNADSIVDYLLFAKKYIRQCEDKYGEELVELVLDACHSLQYVGVDKYKRVVKSKSKMNEELSAIDAENERLFDMLMDTTTIKKKKDMKDIKFPIQPEENILYFIEKYSPKLDEWKRELIRIVRKISQYFYPQILTKTINEGLATFTHYHIMYNLWEKGIIPESSMFEFLESHSSVIWQPDFNSKYYNGFNPYALGFAIFMDIKRMCLNPTDEDREWFPDVVGKNWIEMTHYVMDNFKDDTFIIQFLSPKVMRDLRLFYILDEAKDPNYLVKRIHNDRGYREIRKKLSDSYDWIHNFPDIQVESVDMMGDRILKLKYYKHNDYDLETKNRKKTLKYIEYLWGYPVEIV